VSGSDDLKARKAERRKYYRTLQASFTAEQYSAWNKLLTPPLRDFGASIPAGSLVAVYHAKSKEADLSPLFSLPLRFCFPKIIDRAGGTMEFREVENLAAEHFKLGPYGIFEPQHHHPTVDKAAVHTAFIPLLAFDGQGRRLGQGMGFYDRFLHGFQGRRVGVGFDWQGSPQPLAVDDHDEPLHAIVTEHGVQRFVP